jgi:predicted metal-binding membrane protein
MSLLAVSVPVPDLLHLGLFFGLMVVMMVAMMLPSALPMIITYHGITRLEGGAPKKPADPIATTIFTGTYFLLWGTFGVLVLLIILELFI